MTSPFPELPHPSVAIAGRDARFPVHRIYCVGRNYADHVREMGGTVADKGTPVFFCKPADAVVASGSTIGYARATGNLHFEAELVIAIGRDGADISIDAAPEYIFGYAVGCDLTRRDLQARAKEKAQPWDLSKAFDDSAPISAIREGAAINHSARLWLSVNQSLKQDTTLDQMIWSVPEIIAELSRFFMLRAGDLIFTGTPAGVGPLVPGDQVTAGIHGVGELQFALAR
jgi:fumarylpyruvate hydrolase